LREDLLKQQAREFLCAHGLTDLLQCLSFLAQLLNFLSILRVFAEVQLGNILFADAENLREEVAFRPDYAVYWL